MFSKDNITWYKDKSLKSLDHSALSINCLKKNDAIMTCSTMLKSKIQIVTYLNFQTSIAQ